MRVFDFNRAILRAPSRSVARGLRAVDLGAPDFDGVVREQRAYARALEGAGVEVEVLPPLEDFPDSIFVEDVALVFTGAAILLRPGARTRAGEALEMLPALEGNFERVLRLNAGTVDGGDVLATGPKVFIGRSARTNEEGAKALTALLAGIGLTGAPVATPKGVLHFKSDCSLLDEDTILSTRRLSASGVFEGFRVIDVPEGEESAANAVRVNDRVFVSDAFPRTADMLDNRGFKIVPLATREIAKVDAGLSCMSLRWFAR